MLPANLLPHPPAFRSDLHSGVMALPAGLSQLPPPFLSTASPGKILMFNPVLAVLLTPQGSVESQVTEEPRIQKPQEPRGRSRLASLITNVIPH